MRTAVLYTPLFVILLFAILFCQNAAYAKSAEKSDTQFSGKLQVGSEYQSNLHISELNTAAGKSDQAYFAETALQGSWQLSNDLQAEAGYQGSMRRYSEFDDYDLDLHIASLALNYQWYSLTIASSYVYANAQLSGDAFMTLQQGSLSVARLMQQQFYLRGAITTGNKQFAAVSSRNANILGATSDLFWVRQNGNQLLFAGLLYDIEDTADNQFQYQAAGIKLGFSQQFTAMARKHKAQINWRYQQRFYNEIPAGATQRRRDTHHQLEGQLELGLTSYLSLILLAGTGNYQSIISSADYSEHRAAAGIKAWF